MEKKLHHNVSQFMDRCTTNIAQSQTGFINFIIMPSFGLITRFLENTKVFLDQIEQNKQSWEQLLSQYEKKMEEEKEAWEEKQSQSESSILIKE